MLERPAARRPERRYIIERRLLPERRRGLDRRVGPRRFQIQWVHEERRLHADRRRGGEQRSPFPRRRSIDRRGSGIVWVGPPPN